MSCLLITIPHSGEKIPPGADWLKTLPEEVLMCDVDRYVDRIYEPTLQKLSLPFVKTDWHRYAVDLNRIPEDVDRDSLEGQNNPSGTHSRGFHWTLTTYNHSLMKKPMSVALHQELRDLIYTPFHQEVQRQHQELKKSHPEIFHLDAHSMPSLGTKMHRDPGERRADIVVSDCGGKSCKPEFRDLVIAAYCVAGFKVGYNWPYLGGRVTEQYGRPAQGVHAIQVELNRDLYMDETTKKYKEEAAGKIQERISMAMTHIVSKLPV